MKTETKNTKKIDDETFYIMAKGLHNAFIQYRDGELKFHEWIKKRESIFKNYGFDREVFHEALKLRIDGSNYIEEENE